MLIRDLEFINSSDVDSSSSAIKGGAFVDTFAKVDINGNSIDANAGALAVGDSTRANTETKAKIISTKYYTAGYGYAKGIATARSGRDYKFSASYDSGVI